MTIDYILQNIQVFGIKEIELSNGKRLCYLIKCEQCNELHYKAQCELIKGYQRNKRFFCSRKCHHDYQSTTQKVVCTNCNTVFEKLPSQITKSKSGNNFCSKSCAATFNNKNKSYGTRRSKLEEHIEDQLKINYPHLIFQCNSKVIIGSELDFYFPSLKLAIQLNGPLHYQPIYGQNKLNQIQLLDQEKRNICNKTNIKLIEIDCSNDKYLNKNLKNKRWEEIKNILAESTGLDPDTLASTTSFPN